MVGVKALDQVQVGVEQHQRVRQVVGRHHPAAVAADGDVAHVQAGAHLGHHGRFHRSYLVIQPSREPKNT